MYRTLLIDDEKLARQRMRMLLEESEVDVDIVGEASNGEEALRLIDRLRPDLLFLDIQMPEMTGFQMLEHLEEPPLVIFVTAYDEFALRAFKEHSIDYLLKPVEPERLQVALHKLQRITQKTDTNNTVHQLLASLRQPYLTRISVQVGDRRRLLKTNTITHFTADNKYTVVHAEGKKHLISTSLSELEQKLDPDQFLRIHRSTIVQIDCIQEIYRFAKGKLRVVLKGHPATELDVGRRFVTAVRQL